MIHGATAGRVGENRVTEDAEVGQSPQLGLQAPSSGGFADPDITAGDWEHRHGVQQTGALFGLTPIEQPCIWRWSG